MTPDLEFLLEQGRKAARTKRCDICNKKIKPTFKATSDPLDWSFLSCDECLEDFCPKCCDVDESGKCLCRLCFESFLHQPK